MTRLANLSLDTLEDLPHPCRDCAFWELDQRAGADAGAVVDPGLEKEAWISQTLLEWGSCGKLVYVDGIPAGYVIYAPPAYLPRAGAFPTGPASPDAALLTNAYVIPRFAGTGLGRLLVQGAAQDLGRRGLRALEAFGDARGVAAGCVAPAGFYVAVGFKTVRPHPRYPRLRLELRGAQTGQAEGYALARLLGTVRQAGAVRSPVRVARNSRTSIEPVGTSDSTG
jgi:GNAT superfamily N-acetyltransferase